MQNRILNCAVVGLGVGEQHSLAFLQHHQTNLTDIIDLNPQKIADFIRKYSLKNIASRDFQQVAADVNNHLISIASFDDMHFEQVIASLHHKKHVFVEKPLCQTREQLEDIYNAWIQKRVGLSSNLVLRKAPLYSWLKEIIASNQLGEIYAFDGDYLYGRIHKITQGWRKNIPHYSVMAGGGIHMIDLMLSLTGQKPTHVQSCSNKIATQDTEFKYDDFHSAVFHFQSGMIGRITANFGCMHRHQHVVRVFGTKGTFIYDDMGSRIHWGREEDSQPELINLAHKPLHKGVLIEDFIQHILQDNLEEMGKREFDLMTVALAADAALRTQIPLKINYLTFTT